MRKSFKLQELDCANCAAKMERGIQEIKGVKEANISFMTQKLTIEADAEAFQDILQKAQKVVKSIEKDCVIVL